MNFEKRRKREMTEEEEIAIGRVGLKAAFDVMEALPPPGEHPLIRTLAHAVVLAVSKAQIAMEAASDALCATEDGPRAGSISWRAAEVVASAYWVWMQEDLEFDSDHVHPFCVGSSPLLGFAQGIAAVLMVAKAQSIADQDEEALHFLGSAARALIPDDVHVLGGTVVV